MLIDIYYIKKRTLKYLLVLLFLFLPYITLFPFGTNIQTWRSFFREGVEAECFRNIEELQYKTKKYLKNSLLLKQIANNAYERLESVCHEVVDRVREALKKYDELVK